MPIGRKKQVARVGVYFDSERYRRRVVVEHANAWPDVFKTWLVRCQTSVGNWLPWH